MSDPRVVSILQQAESLRNVGRIGECVSLLEPLAASHGHVPGVWHHLGIALAMSKRHGEAAAALQRAAEVEPDSPEVLNNLAAVLLVCGRAADAMPPLERAIALRPDYADAKRNLANALYHVGDAAANAGDLARAVEVLERAIAIAPSHARAIGRLASVRRQQGDFDSAVDLFRRARQLAPDDVDTLTNLGEALHAGGHADEAVEPLSRALQLKPDHAAALVNLGCVRVRQARIDEAVDQFDAAIRLDPGGVGAARAHMNLGMALLHRGDYARGWHECEWRFRQRDAYRPDHVYFRVTPWRGEPLGGRAIFTYVEQGFGDAFHFARYVPMIKSRGAGRVIVGCRPSLRRLFERLDGVDDIVEAGETIPPVDVQCPFMSLPLAFGTTSLDRIPANVPYLSPPAELVETWRAKLADVPGLKVGLTWAGSPNNPRDRYRSMPVESLAPLAPPAGVTGVTFFSLQRDPPYAAAAPLHLIDHTRELADWADTAALMTNLDLVISVDTAVTHLAGALARPTWTLLPAAGEWRWLIGRTDSPWYPTMRLFRQQTLGDWRDVIARVAADLSKFPKLPT